jgi:outer membrane protein TolC
LTIVGGFVKITNSVIIWLEFKYFHIPGLLMRYSMTRKMIVKLIRISICLLLFAGLFKFISAEDVQRLSLADAVAQALRSHPEVAGARLDMQAAEARIMQVTAFQPPELNFTLDAMPGIFKPAEADEQSVGISQSFEFPVKTKYRRDLARFDLRLAEISLQNKSVILAVQVKKSYLKVLFAQAQIANLERVAALLKQFADLATARYAAQSGTYLEVLRARLEMAKRNKDLVGWRSALVRDTASLKRLLGIRGSMVLFLTDTFQEPPFLRTLEQELAVRLPNHSQLLRGSAQIDRQSSEAQLSRLGFWPDFSLGLAYQRLNGQPPYNSNGFSGSRSSGWAIELGFSLPFLINKGRRGEILQARASLEKARIGLQAAERDVALAIENAYQLVISSAAQVGVFKDSLLADSHDQLQAAMELYNLKQLDSWQLLDALRSEIEINSDYSQTLYQFNLALTDLEGAGETENPGEENEE